MYAGGCQTVTFRSIARRYGKVRTIVKISEHIHNIQVSSNTWVGAGQAYVTTSSSVATNQPVVCYALLLFWYKSSSLHQFGSYGSGNFSGQFIAFPYTRWVIHNDLGNEFLDTVTITPALVIRCQSIGVATSVYLAACCSRIDVLTFSLHSRMDFRGSMGL